MQNIELLSTYLDEAIRIRQDLHQIPGLFISIGTGNASKGFDENLHSLLFDFDEKMRIKGLEMSLKFINYTKKY